MSGESKEQALTIFSAILCDWGNNDPGYEHQDVALARINLVYRVVKIEIYFSGFRLDTCTVHVCDFTGK